MKDREIITLVRKSRNLFVLDLAIPGKVMKVSHTGTNNSLVDNIFSLTQQAMVLKD